MQDRCMWCMFSPGDDHFSVFQCSLVYKAFLSKLARCSKQPNYWVKPGLSLPTAQHPASVSDPRERPLSSLPMSYTPLALPGLRFPSHSPRTPARNPGCERKLWSGNRGYDTAWHLITAALALVLMLARTSFFKQGMILGKSWRGGGGQKRMHN